MSKVSLIDGRALPLRGNDIDTDRIIPARFLVTVTFDGLDQHVFEDDRRSAQHPFDDPRYQGASVLVVNSNFGCGSSREHAPQALYRWGIRAVVGESFSEIFFGNAVMLGMPCVTAAPADVRALQDLAAASPQAVATIDLTRGICDARAGSAPSSSFAISLPGTAREALTTGAWNATAALLSDQDAIDRVAEGLPYLSGFRAG